MTNKSFEKLQESEELRVNFGINIEMRDSVDSKNSLEVVYKPTTIDIESNGNSKFQSLKLKKFVTPKDSFYLYRTAFIAMLTAFAAGIGFSWTSPVFPKLQGPENPLSIKIDASQESIVAAILCVGAAVGPFPFGYLAEKIGRKRTLLIIAWPMVIAMVILAFASEVKLYYLARLLHGAGSGGVFTVLTMYIGEITEDHNRGKFCCIMSVFITLGLLYPFSIGPLLSIRIFSLSCLLPLLVFLIIFTIYCPETPIYLIKKGEDSAALTTLIDLRDTTEDQAQKGLNELRVVVDKQKHEKSGISEIFKTKSSKKAFIVSVGLLIIQQVSGINAVMGFLENIFRATGSSISPQVSTTFIGLVQVLTVLVTAAVVEKLGRKFLFLSSISGASVSLIFLGLYFFLQRSEFSLLAHFWWLPLVSLFIYIVSYNLGLGPVPWTILSEVFPDNVKASASALASSINFATSFVITMAFPIISESLGMAGSFWIFGVCCVLALFFTYYVVPETKGKTLSEIQEMLSK